MSIPATVCWCLSLHHGASLVPHHLLTQAELHVRNNGSLLPDPLHHHHLHLQGSAKRRLSSEDEKQVIGMDMLLRELYIPVDGSREEVKVLWLLSGFVSLYPHVSGRSLLCAYLMTKVE